MSDITSAPLAHFHQRVADKSRDNSLPSVVIVALGDSVTTGMGAENQFLHDEVYHAQLKRMLEQRYPQCVFSVINCGDSGQNAAGGVAKLERDVLHHQPDLLLIGFGLNDAVRTGNEGLETYGEALQKMIERARATTPADIILLTPNMMLQHENANIPDQWRHVIEVFLQIQKDGVVSSYAERAREVGRQNTVKVADVYAAWQVWEASGVDVTAHLANGLNHPDAEGHRLTAQVIMRAIEQESTT